jgi:regulator of cell morphogenesis and NO signaling
MSLIESQSLASRPLGEIAANIPGATAVFRRYKLDFCCGGAETLEEAARHKGVDSAQVESELRTLAPTRSEVPDSNEDIIAHIVERYHNVHRREIPELRALARRVEAVHVDHAAVPVGLANILGRMQAEMESHMQKEEQILFPMMLAGGNPMIVHPIAMMRHEHDEHGENLAAVAVLTNDLTLPAEACNTWRALYAGLAKLAEDLTEHMHIENNILFPRFEAQFGE